MKKYFVPVILTFILISCTSPTAVMQETHSPVITDTKITSTPARRDLPVPGEIAQSHVDFLSNEIGPRPTNTEQESQAAQYIVTTLEKLGYAPETQHFSVSVKDELINSANVIAIKPGISPQEIIVGAHYDSPGIGRGADDNASGVGALLEAAERVRIKPIPYTIRFIFFGAEEVGLQGSKYYAGQMTGEEIINTIAMINLDALTAGDIAYVYGDAGEKGQIRDWALQFAQDNRLTLQTQPGAKPEYPPGTTGDWSDHAPFKSMEIPYTYFESTNWMLGDQDGFTQTSPEFGENGQIWHTQYDTLEYIDSAFPGRLEERLNLFVTVLEGILTEYHSR